MVNCKNSLFCRKNRGRRRKIDALFPTDFDKKSEVIQLVGGFGSGNRYRFGTKDAVEEYCALDVRKLNREGMLDPGYRGSLAWRQGERKVSSIMLVAEHGRVVLKYRHRRGGLGDEWEDVEQPVYL